MKRLLLLLLPGVLLGTGCQSREDNPVGPAPGVRFPLVQDTTRAASQPLAAHWLASTTHPVLYIGSYRDPVLVAHDLTAFPRPPLPDGTLPPAPLSAFARYGELVAAPPHWKHGQQARLGLSLNTTTPLKGKRAVQEANRTAVHWLDSYPVLVHNQDRDTVVIGYGDFLPLTLEAKDRQGQWRAIEEPYAYRCGNGLPLLFLPPHQIVVTSVFIPHGPFQTALRIRLGKNLSAPFTGSIHPHQFDRPPQEE